MDNKPVIKFKISLDPSMMPDASKRGFIPLSIIHPIALKHLFTLEHLIGALKTLLISKQITLTTLYTAHDKLKCNKDKIEIHDLKSNSNIHPYFLPCRKHYNRSASKRDQQQANCELANLHVRS